MRGVYVALVLSALTAVPAAAQSNVEVNAGVQFDFLSPGARSMAMGSAFIGVADDATAAFTNPAGLRALTRREVSFEGRGRNFDIPVAFGGRFGGAPSGRGIDTDPNLIIADQSQSAGGLSFLSFVYPSTRWAIAGYRHELANFDTAVETQGLFYGVVDTSSEGRQFPMRGTMDLNIATYGVSGSFNVTPTFSLGAGVAVYDFQMSSRSNRFSIGIGNFYGPPNFAASNLQNFQTQEGDETKVGVNLGAIFAPTRMFQVGAVFRQGPEFDLSISNALPSGEFQLDRPGRFHVPHVFGVGVLFRPITNGTVTVDVSRVGYSRMTEGFVDIFTEEGTEAGNYSVNDATEFHAGFEYVFTRQLPVAVRAGYWRDPEHTLRYTGEDLSELAIFGDRGEDQHHFTFGGGVVFGRFEVNGAVDTASRTRAFSASAVVRF